MSHYTVKFIGTKLEKEAQALRAAKEYLGTKRYKVLTDTLQGLPARQRINTVRLAFAITGIDSYWSLRAIVKATGPKAPTHS